MPLSPDDRQRIDALLAYLPMMESGYAGEWRGGERGVDGTITMPWFEYNERVLAFIRACGENGWIEVYEWPSWVAEARRYHDVPAAMATADLGDIRKLLTLHIRNDRFNEGHLAAMVEDGHLAAILRRLQGIRDEAD